MSHKAMNRKIKTNFESEKDLILENFSDVSEFCFNLNEIDQSKKVLIESHLSLIETLKPLLNTTIKCVLQDSIQSLNDKVKLLSKINGNKNNFFEKDFSFISGKILNHNFTHQSDRSKILDYFFDQNNLDTDLVKNQKLYQVASELIMNAQIDAPKYSSNNNNQSSLIIIEKNEDINLLSISVIDYYGSLDCKKMVKKIFDAYENGFRESMSSVGHGAGLGAAMLYGYVDSLFIGCQPHKVSRVTAILPLALSEKKIDQIKKTICIVEE